MPTYDGLRLLLSFLFYGRGGVPQWITSVRITWGSGLIKNSDSGPILNTVYQNLWVWDSGICIFFFFFLGIYILKKFCQLILM